MRAVRLLGQTSGMDRIAEAELNGSAADITESEKVEFLQYSRQGYNRQEAAMALGYKARPWRAITSPESRFYDEDFTNRYAEVRSSPEAKMNFLERLREETTRRGLMDSDRLLEKLMMVHDPDWQVLRQKDVNVDISVVLQQRFKDLPTPLLKQLLDALDQTEKGEIVEAEFAEITAGGNDGHQG